MISNVKALGTPKVKDGEGIAGVITNGLTTVQTGFKDALSSAQDSPHGEGRVPSRGHKMSEEARRLVEPGGQDLRLRQQEVRHEVGRRGPQEDPDCDGLS